MITFLKRSDHGAAELRADELSLYLQESDVEASTMLWGTAVKGVRDCIVVFVKYPHVAMATHLKKQGCKLVWDVLDFFAVPREAVDVGMVGLLDAIIVPTLPTVAALHPIIPKGCTMIRIPHAWDRRIKVWKREDEFRAGYIGQQFNHAHMEEIPDVLGIYQWAQMTQYAGLFNCHYNVRHPLSAAGQYKPGTKLATAAAVGANIVTTRDAATIELLGNEYPYYTDPELEAVQSTLKRARFEYGTDTWLAGLEQMAQMREQLSPRRIAQDYVELFSGMDACPTTTTDAPPSAAQA